MVFSPSLSLPPYLGRITRSWPLLVRPRAREGGWKVENGERSDARLPPFRVFFSVKARGALKTRALAFCFCYTWFMRGRLKALFSRLSGEDVSRVSHGASALDLALRKRDLERRLRATGASRSQAAAVASALHSNPHETRGLDVENPAGP